MKIIFINEPSAASPNYWRQILVLHKSVNKQRLFKQTNTSKHLHNKEPLVPRSESDMICRLCYDTPKCSRKWHDPWSAPWRMLPHFDSWRMHHHSWTYDGCTTTWTHDGCNHYDGLIYPQHWSHDECTSTWTHDGCTIILLPMTDVPFTWTDDECITTLAPTTDVPHLEPWRMYLHSWNYDGCTQLLDLWRMYHHSWTYEGCTLDMDPWRMYAHSWTHNVCTITLLPRTDVHHSWTYDGCTIHLEQWRMHPSLLDPWWINH